MKPVTLYIKDQSGQTRYWKIWTSGATLFTESGQVGGQAVFAQRRCEPKNLGRSNETSAEEQAEFEALAKVAVKERLGYSGSVDIAEEGGFVVAPMLAHKGENIRPSASSPWDVQLKLDGHRMLAWKQAGQLALMSRGRKPYTTVPHIRAALERVLPPGVLLDGELYCHGVPFQQLSSWIRRNQADTLRLQYYVYDMVDLSSKGDAWSTRRAKLDKLFTVLPPSLEGVVVKCKSITCSSLKHLERLKQVSLESGYEGLILRAPQGKYKFGGRSKELLKVKKFDDAEYRVVDVVPGVGKFEDLGVFQLVTHDGKHFSAAARGTEEERRAFLRNRRGLQGRSVTVRYMGVSESGIPRHPVVVRVHECF